MKCICGHKESQHDENFSKHGGRECLSDVNQNGKRFVFCKCKNFTPYIKDASLGGEDV